jgi:hypothetical protein
MWKDETNSCFVATFGCFVTIYIVTKCYALQEEEEEEKRQSNNQGNKHDDA